MSVSGRDVTSKYVPLIDHALMSLVLTLLVFTALIFNRQADGPFLTPKSCFFQLALSAALALWAARTVFSARISITRTPLNLPLFIFLILAAVSALRAPFPVLSRQDLTLIALAMLYYVIVAEIIEGKNAIRLLLFVLVGLSGLAAFYGILQYHHVDFIGGWIGRKHMFSTLGNPNFLAQYLICILPVSLIMLLTGRRLQAVLCGLSFFISGWALLLTQTRAAWAGALISFLYLVFLFAIKEGGFFGAHKKRLWLLPAFLAAVAILFVGLNWVGQRPEATGAMVHRIKTSPRDPFREFVWRGGWRMFRDHPVSGVGLGHFRVFYPGYQAAILAEEETPSYIIPTYVRRAHNEYLQAAAELGLPGVLLALWLIIALLWHGLRVYSGIRDPGGRKIAAALSAACLAVLVNAFFSFPFRVTSTAAVFICLAALITSTGRAYGVPLRRKGIDLPFLRSAVLAWPVILIFLLLSLLLSAHAVGRLAADVYLKKGYALVNENRELDQAVSMLTRAIHLNPAEGRCRFALGSARYRKGDAVRAIADIGRALETFRDANAYHSLGTAYMVKGDREKAVAMWRKAVGIRPDLADSLMCLGLASLEERQLGEAMGYLEKAGILAPRYAAARYMLGHVYILQNRPMRAVSTWEKFLSLNPEQAELDALHYLALASLKAGGYLDPVPAAWPDALRFASGNTRLKNMLDKFHQAAGAGGF
jgi:O-antigen ligase/Flp pilus assembly protein TadD